MRDDIQTDLEKKALKFKRHSADSLQRPCSADVADFTGYHFHKCGKPAKWDVGNYGARCGLHARGKYFEGIRKPLPPNAESSDLRD